MRKLLIFSFFSIIILNLVLAKEIEVLNNEIFQMGNFQIDLKFGMVIGRIFYKLGNLTWAPEEIWFLEKNVTPSQFLKDAEKIEILEIPQNLTFSTCRTLVYFSKIYGYGFKIYNTITKVQIFNDGKFCGLAYNGSYYVYASY